MPCLLYSWEEAPVIIGVEAWGASGLVWTDMEKRKSLSSNRIRTLVHPLCSESYY
jgi:hypothetical protein